MAQASYNHKAANLWVSRIIPLFLIGIVGYVTWVVVVSLCVNVLLKPTPSAHTPRNGVAIAIVVLYASLLLLIGLTYFRLLYTVTFNPGYVPRSSQGYTKRTSGFEGKNTPNNDHEFARSQSASEKAVGRTGIEAAPSLRDFYSKDVFVCQGDGRPIWCSTCNNYKPDRAHHCREIERCVKKMDHFCPWVGGVVSETSFKFFIQFVAWAAVYCIFSLIVMAYFLAEYRRKTQNLNIHWLVTTCLGALFGLFTIGMTGSSLQFALLNSTTIENLSRKTFVWQLAIYMPRPPDVAHGFRTISFSTTSGPSATEPNTRLQQSDDIRTYAILHTKPGENPFDLGLYGNFKSVMGNHWYDWFLPFTYSPCCDHGRIDGQFAMGPAVQRMREEVGIAAPLNTRKERGHRKRRRRRHHRKDESQNRPTITKEKHALNGATSNHDRVCDDVDLERGLGHVNGSLT